ncbi:isoflavone reductase family protein [Mycena rosella]|uniref:Isoflavone reductase family protein n=1 Tax=Mycena rosella TaxID=1033263 RepID=A0AAD7GUH1_MYCRO|nr:isoflavone reductase family protein [Mycena rosella]
MVKQHVLLLGATGETGGSILNGLLADPESFDVAALVRPTSAKKSQVQDLVRRGVTIRVVDLDGALEDVVGSLAGIDVLINAIGAGGQLAQLTLAMAAKQAGVKRFVPCAFATVAPPGGVMQLRDAKEEIYQLIRRLYLPYTVIDVGYWHQISFPTLPSGRIDYAAVVLNMIEIHAEGTMPTMLTDLRDIGPFVARIIKDPRTLNKFVVAYADVLCENEIFALMEEMSGEVIQRKYVPADAIIDSRARHMATLKVEPDNGAVRFTSIMDDYMYSKYVRGDNTPAYAAYLGYLDARALYPEFRPRSFRDFFAELLEGKGVKPYPALDLAALYQRE